MQISSESSSYTNSAYSSNGVSGLMSGMDTEGLVKSMLSGIQTKIDRQNQQKTQLEWKQESYRDVISKINSFQSKYLDLTSSTSLRTTGFFNQMKSESSNSAVKINSASSGTSQDFKIQVAQLATATKLTSGKFSTGEIKMDLDAIAANMEEHFSAPEQNITFKVGDQEVSINLCEVESGADDKPSLENMVDKINTQLQAGGIYAELEIGEDNKIKVSNTDDESRALTISGSSNALSTLGLKAMTVEDVYESTTAADASKLENTPPTTAEINVTLDGKTKTLSITNGSKDQVLESLTSQMKAAFGSSVTIDKQTGTITAKQGQTLSFSGDTSVLGIEQGACTRLTTSTKLSDLGIEGDNYTFKINNKEFEFTADNTVNDVINKINSSGVGAKMVYNSLSDSFTLTSTETGEGFALTVEGNLGEKFFKDAKTTAGQNAIVNIDGVTVERTSNNISYNGVSMELRGVTGDYFDESGVLVENEDGTLAAADGTEDKAAEITANRDTSKVMETIKSFVEDYNKLIEELNKLTHQKKSYKEYAPLTEAQKKEMSESEITAWEKKAHEGLLSGDSDINKFLSSMRSTIYSTTSGGTSLSMFGIDTSSNWKDYGKLEIDEKKLTEFLSSDAEAVISTFTSVANGLNDACKAAANTSSASPGSLVALAGVEGRVSEKNNTIKKQLDAIAEKIKNLQSVYDQRKERYWKQFNAMEQVIGNMSSTSSYLTSMLGY
ncbi:MAG: flagellar filament capping protein FliD [Ruminococcus sp.]|nr:flagellar filament capping protein FliD [Ruminococcus sp.]